MLFEVLRISSQKNSTLGVLYSLRGGRRFLCFTLEDEHRTEKVAGETRIPQGLYMLRLRTFGGHHERYKDKFPLLHQGMIELLNVPNFTDILVHIGNYEHDTSGCLLLGNNAMRDVEGEHQIMSSTNAYERVYPLLRDAVLTGDTYIQILDHDAPRGEG